MKRVFTLVGIVVALIGTTSNSHASASTNSPRVGTVPPPLLLSEVAQGPAIGEISWDKLQGKVVVLEFWDTRCVPCVKAIPHLNELANKFSSKPVVFLGISEDNKDHLKAFLKRTPIKGWLALDQPFNPTRTGFDVIAVPHTVIIDSTGKIAAITYPEELDVAHLEEILEGKPSTLPAFVPDLTDAGQDTVAVTNLPPTKVEVSIKGPFPRPKHGAFNSRGWEQPQYGFVAREAWLRDVLSSFFGISSDLIIEKVKLPDGLYNVSAVAPLDKLPELKTQFVEMLKTNLGIAVSTEEREVEVYAMTVCASNAPGLKPTRKSGGGGERSGGFRVNGTNMKEIASYLDAALNKPVIDETGLTGLWNVDIKWEMSDSELHHGRPDPVKVLKAARDQLGFELKLVNRSLPVLLVEAARN